MKLFCTSVLCLTTAAFEYLDALMAISLCKLAYSPADEVCIDSHAADSIRLHALLLVDLTAKLVLRWLFYVKAL